MNGTNSYEKDLQSLYEKSMRHSTSKISSQKDQLDGGFFTNSVMSTGSAAGSWNSKEMGKSAMKNVTSSMNIGGGSVDRPLDQLEVQTKRLLKRTALEGTHEANALLASKGVDTQKIRNLLDSLQNTQAFEPKYYLKDTDVEGYLQNQHELQLIEALENSRKKVWLNFCRYFPILF